MRFREPGPTNPECVFPGSRQGNREPSRELFREPLSPPCLGPVSLQIFVLENTCIESF